jgi:hypothetical protein
MSIDITRPGVFAAFSAVCIVCGGLLGILCAYLFYTVSHVRIGTMGTHATTQIDPMWGIVFILIMAATAFCIAMTFHLVPKWVARYYEAREVPPFAKWIRDILLKIEEFLEEEKE